MACQNSRLSSTLSQVPPVVSELEAIFRELPDEGLLTKLRGPRRRGRPGYDPEILWRCYVAFFYMGHLAQHLDHTVASDAAIHLDGQTLTGEVID